MLKCPVCGLELDGTLDGGSINVAPQEDGSFSTVTRCPRCFFASFTSTIEEFWTWDKEKRDEERQNILGDFMSFANEEYDKACEGVDGQCITTDGR